jgi:general secretion pathway protein A
MYYEEYFAFSTPPFSISPDPHFLYLTPQHQEALAHLLHGITAQNGFVLLTGEVGVGKTTLCQSVLDRLPDNTDVAFILNPKLEPDEFFATTCDELGIDHDPGQHGMRYYTGLISAYLLEAHSVGWNTVLLIDEAQCLSHDLIETIRLLTNLETHEKKLLQIILVGQPQLRDLLAMPSMEQVSQRITARFHLGPLSRKEVKEYVAHRLRLSGGRKGLFTGRAINRLHKLTRGVPRLINIICDRALMGAYVRRDKRVSSRVLEVSAREVLGGHYVPSFRDKRPLKSVLVYSLVVTLVFIGTVAWLGMGAGGQSKLLNLPALLSVVSESLW